MAPQAAHTQDTRGLSRNVSLVVHMSFVFVESNSKRGRRCNLRLATPGERVLTVDVQLRPIISYELALFVETASAFAKRHDISLPCSGGGRSAR